MHISIHRYICLHIYSAERLVMYCRTASASTALRTARRTCCPHAHVLITGLRVSRCGDFFLDSSNLHRPPHTYSDLGSWILGYLKKGIKTCLARSAPSSRR